MDFSTRGMYKTHQSSTTYDEGLREYMLSIYNNMSVALAITGLVAKVVSTMPALLYVLYGTPLSWAVMFAPIIFIMAFQYKLMKMSVRSAYVGLFAFSALMGLSTASIFIIYTATSIAKSFFITAALFGSMSIYGHTTKKSLTDMASFMMMGIFGIIIASIVNIFVGSSALEYLISVVAVIAFTGMTAYETQTLKGQYYTLGSSSDLAQKVAVMGALNLYMSFLNIFMHVLHLLNDRER